MYAQVLTDLKVSTYVDAAYEVQLIQSHTSGDTSISSSVYPAQSTGIINPETGASQASEGLLGGQ